MITRYAPNDRLRTLSSFTKFMDDMFGESQELRSGWVPPVDIKETPTDLTFSVEIPGMKQEDIDVEMIGEILTIRGKRELSNEERQDDFVRIERSYGEFQRSFTVGVPVKASDVSASYKDGVLTVRVPKADEVKPRKINISNNQ